ncbi:DinB family protein [Sanyastnella coralliicola]|uniref:DinB family protein n=1 Tax=Sanyastnella coralliicola TaxID=3069118 RepID=UPI0027BAA4B4|nr:DinB family protein [Longitalea sp. SCSIO 12813]
MMNALIAKHLREAYFGRNWPAANVEEHLADVTWEQALQPIAGKNTIAALTFHIGYFVNVALRVLEGGPLEGKDSESFDHPPIENEEQWRGMVNGIFDSVRRMADLIEELPESIWDKDFTDPKYGNYYRNIGGIIEHSYYHLGQIVLLKTLF